MLKKGKVLLVGSFVLALALCFGGCSKKVSQEVTSEMNDESQNLIAYQQKILQLEQLLKTDPKNLQALIEMGNCYYDLGNSEKAITYYTKALEIDPKNTDVRTDMGTCYKQLGQLDKALEEYEKSLEYAPNHATTFFNRGVVLHQKGSFTEAIKSWEKYLELEPEGKLKLVVHDYIERAKKQMESAAASTAGAAKK